jgi:hypothetical protein
MNLTNRYLASEMHMLVSKCAVQKRRGSGGGCWIHFLLFHHVKAVCQGTYTSHRLGLTMSSWRDLSNSLLNTQRALAGPG